MLKAYYKLTKPGIVYGNALAVVSGSLFAFGTSFNSTVFLAALIGSSLAIGSGCVFNNYLDREIDKAMPRTKTRSLATGEISSRNALVFGTILGVLGISLLALYTNPLTAWIGVVGILLYVLVYGWAKRATTHGTLIGSVAGAVPPLAGYTAVTGQLDSAALLLFCISAAWQMAHFYGIAIYRVKEYASAGLPILSVVKGIRRTKNETLIYIAAFIVLSGLLTLIGKAGFTYLVVVMGAGFYWFYQGVYGYSKLSDPVWGRTIFKTSLYVLIAFSVMISLNAFLP